MGETRLLLQCSAKKEKEVKEILGGMIVSRFEDPDKTYETCLPVFRCEDTVRVASNGGKKIKQTVVSYQPTCYSPATHIRFGTAYGSNRKEILEFIEKLNSLLTN